jgi:hypothetical protein
MEVGQGPNWGCSAKEKKKNKYVDDCEEPQLLILTIFVKIRRIIFKVLNFKFTVFLIV